MNLFIQCNICNTCFLVGSLADRQQKCFMNRENRNLRVLSGSVQSFHSGVFAMIATFSRPKLCKEVVRQTPSFLSAHPNP